MNYILLCSQFLSAIAKIVAISEQQIAMIIIVKFCNKLQIRQPLSFGKVSKNIKEPPKPKANTKHVKKTKVCVHI